MKKMFLFAAFAGIALASCTTDEEIFAPVNQGNEIEFVAANYVHQTRAEHDDATFTNSDYAVWAWKNGDNTPYMDSVKVDFTRGNEVDGTYYWPNYALDFAAVTPYGDKRISLDRTNGNSTITFTFDATNANTTTTNLMYADFVESQSYDSDKREGKVNVALKFRHVLAKLNVVAHQLNPNPLPDGITGYDVTINSLSFNGMLCEGKLEVEEGVYDGKTKNYLWTPAETPSTKADWSIISTETNIKDADFATNYGHGNHNYLVMPQTIPADAKLNITYTVKTTFANRTTSTKEFTKDVALKDIKDGSNNPITEWRTNKNITYTINIKPADLTPITFSATEEEWGTQGGAHTF